MKLQHKLLIATSFLAAISFNAVADSESKPCNSKSIKGHYTSMLTKGLSSVGGVAIDSVSTNYFDGDQIVTQIGDRTRDGVTSYNTTTTGTYEVGADCRVTISLIPYAVGVTNNFIGYLADNGKKIFMIREDHNQSYIYEKR